MSNSLTTLEKYYICNREIYKKRSKKHYEQNKIQINYKRRKPVPCQCGSIVCHSSMRRHLKTAKHTDWIPANIKTILVTDVK
jgi:hypothetical protein